MKKSLFLFCFALVSLYPSYACINGDTKVLTDGTEIFIDREGSIIPHGHIFTELDYSEKLAKLDRLWKQTKNVDYLSDYGIVLILQKNYQEAKRVFQKVETIKPGRYSTAANLGTVYELLGDNKNALKWISKAVAIDPSSHRSSEWLHVKILEAKIKGEQFISSDFLLNTSFGNQTAPQTTLSNEALIKLRDALYYQLNERVSFIKPKDKIVAHLLFDLANVCVLTNARHEAAYIYKKAKEYGYRDALLERRLILVEGKQATDSSQKVNRVLIKGDTRNNYLAYIIAAVCMLLVGFGMVWRWRSNKLTNKEV